MAYYSNQGTNIYSGAAGYGPLRAYRDGSLGGTKRKTRAAKPRLNTGRKTAASGYGMLRAYKDGSLGNAGPLMAYKDGSLGGASPVDSYGEGSLGFPLFIEDERGIRELEAPVTITHAPFGEYFTGMAGLGAADLPVLDLNDPATVKDVKIAMAALISGTPLINEFPLEFYSDPAWNDTATKLATYWWDAAIKVTTLAVAAARGTQLTSDEVNQIKDKIGNGLVGPKLYPNAEGAVNIVSLAGSAGTPVPPDQIPKLSAFAASAKTSADAAGVPQGKVIPPGGALTQANMLAIGVGAVAVFAALALIFKRR